MARTTRSRTSIPAGSASPARTTGFAVDEKSLPANLRATHVSLFDGTLQGLARTDRPAFCFQGHPEASPGPHDISYLFERFVALMDPQSRSEHA
jgi:carbamoyl-phosphate synthase small subunit